MIESCGDCTLSNLAEASTRDTIHLYGDDVMYVKQGVSCEEAFFFDFDSKPSVLRLELQGYWYFPDGVCFVNVMLENQYIVENKEFWLDQDCENNLPSLVGDCKGNETSFVIDETNLPDGNNNRKACYISSYFLNSAKKYRLLFYVHAAESQILSPQP